MSTVVIAEITKGLINPVFQDLSQRPVLHLAYREDYHISDYCQKHWGLAIIDERKLD